MKEHFSKTIDYFTGLLFLAMVVITFMQVIFRYVFNNSLTWSEEISRYLFVWMSLFGAALAVKYGSHMAMESLVAIFPKKLQKSILIISSILMVGFTILFAYSGVLLIELSTNQHSTALQIPMRYVYTAFPLSGMIMIFYILKNMINKLKDDQKPYQMEIEEVVHN